MGYLKTNKEYFEICKLELLIDKEYFIEGIFTNNPNLHRQAIIGIYLNLFFVLSDLWVDYESCNIERCLDSMSSRNGVKIQIVKGTSDYEKLLKEFDVIVKNFDLIIDELIVVAGKFNFKTTMNNDFKREIGNYLQVMFKKQELNVVINDIEQVKKLKI